MDVLSAATKQSKAEAEDLEFEEAEREKKEKSRLDDYLHDFTAHEGHNHAVFCVSFSPDGRLLLSASGDKTVKIWDLQTRKVLHTFKEHEQWVYSVCFFHHSMAFATGCDDGRVRVWKNNTEPVNHETGWTLDADLGGPKHDQSNKHKAGVQSVDISTDDSYVASASADTDIKLWRLHEKECFLALRGGGNEKEGGHQDWVTRAVFDTESLLMASSSYDRHVKVWRLSDGQCQITFYGHTSWVSDVVWGPEGRTIASASGDFTVRLWLVKTVDDHGREQLADGMPMLILYGHKNWVHSINFSRDGTRLCSASADCSCIVWDIKKKGIEHRIKQKDWLEYAQFTPSKHGDQVATCGHEIDISVWNVARDKAELVALLPRKASYVMLLYYWLRSRIYGDTWKAPPLSHQRHAALRALFDELDKNEEDSAPVSDLIQAISATTLLAPLLDRAENGADLMHGSKPRTVLQALTQWSLSGDDTIRWRELLPLFMDPEEAVSASPEDGELHGTLSFVTSFLRRTTSGRRSTASDAGGAPSGGATPRGSRMPSFLRSSTKASSRSSSLHGSAGGRAPARGGGPRGATYTVELKQTPLGLGCSLDEDNVVTEVRSDAQASRAGIQKGDQVLAINGEAATPTQNVAALLRPIPAGTNLQVELASAESRRGSSAAERTASLAARPSARPQHPLDSLREDSREIERI